MLPGPDDNFASKLSELDLFIVVCLIEWYLTVSFSFQLSDVTLDAWNVKSNLSACHVMQDTTLRRRRSRPYLSYIEDG